MVKGSAAIQTRLKEESAEGPHLVSVILDGENAWEYYPHNGAFFLQALYKRLVEHPQLELCTYSECLDELPDERQELWETTGGPRVWYCPAHPSQRITSTANLAEKGGGYHYDFTRTWCLGYAPEKEQKLYDDVRTVYDQLLSGMVVDMPFHVMQERTGKKTDQGSRSK